MTSFLKGLKLWRYKTGDYVEPTKGDRETKEKFVKNLNEWDKKSSNYQLVSQYFN